MIAMTTSSSMSVKPALRHRATGALSFTVRSLIQGTKGKNESRRRGFVKTARREQRRLDYKSRRGARQQLAGDSHGLPSQHPLSNAFDPEKCHFGTAQSTANQPRKCHIGISHRVKHRSRADGAGFSLRNLAESGVE
jgi:hypothetical protein